MELSVVIVSFNVRDLIKQCLDSVTKAAKGLDVEIFVVDNNSTDDSCEIIQKEFPHVTLIRNSNNRGFSSANNQAISLSKGRYILLLNPDTIIGTDTLTKCLKFADSHPEAGAVGVRMYDGAGNYLPESIRAFPDLWGTFTKSFGLARLFRGSKNLNRYYLPDVKVNVTSETQVIPGAFMFLRKEALDSTGYLDEDFFMYGEDIDISYRLWRNGFRNYYYSDTQITHFKGKSTSRTNYSDIGHFYKSMRLYVIKRINDKSYNLFYYLVIPGIYFRQGLALTNRFLTITFK